MRFSIFAIGWSSALLLGSLSASAQNIRYIDLQPSGLLFMYPGPGTYAYATTGTQQVGDVRVDPYGDQNAALWSGTAASYVNLNPDGAIASVVRGTNGTQQVGYADIGSMESAGLWSGTAASFVNLNPAGSTASRAYAIAGTQQAGYATIGGVQSAGLWSATAGSFVNLNPAGATSSYVAGTTGTVQVGFATFGTAGLGEPGVAALWFGTADSFLNLNPAGASSSELNAVAGTQEAGDATFGSYSNAGIWSGTAGSFVNLAPGASNSSALATDGTHQAGIETIGGAFHAAFWSGTADSFIDLQAVLGSGYDQSYAYGIWTDGTTTYVAGAAETTSDVAHPILWEITTVPEPSSAALLVFGITAAAWSRRRKPAVS